MELICRKNMVAHWGSIFTIDRKYKIIKTINRETTIITNYHEYMKNMSILSSSYKFLKNGYTEENLHEVIPNYITYDIVNSLFTKNINLPFIQIKSDDNSIYEFLTISNKDMIEIYGSDEKDKKPTFVNTIYCVEEYFNFINYIRNEKLIELGL